MRLIVMDANASWVQSLFSAMPAGVAVEWFRPTALSSAMRRGVRSFLSARRKVQENILECRFTYPGWRRFPDWSARVAANRLRGALEASGPATIVYTLPFYSDVAARLADAPAVYFAYDPYSNYEGWDAAEVERREADLLRYCRAVFAISPALADDFSCRTALPVYVQPNGISRDRIAACLCRPARPSDMPAGGKTACCIGQIGSAYDWPLLQEVTSRCRDVTFLFVGPRHAMSGDCQRAADKVFSHSNVVWLGLKRPEELPDYMMNADVLLSPLAATSANNRRSLLRLYDYLATDRPIVSTPVASAVEHGDMTSIAETGEAFAEAIVDGISTGSVDQTARHSYLQLHTWERRAESFLANLGRATACPVPA